MMDAWIREHRVREAHAHLRQAQRSMHALEDIARPIGNPPNVFTLGEDASDYIDACVTLLSFIGAWMPLLPEHVSDGFQASRVRHADTR